MLGAPISAKPFSDVVPVLVVPKPQPPDPKLLNPPGAPSEVGALSAAIFRSDNPGRLGAAGAFCILSCMLLQIVLTVPPVHPPTAAETAGAAAVPARWPALAPIATPPGFPPVTAAPSNPPPTVAIPIVAAPAVEPVTAPAMPATAPHSILVPLPAARPAPEMPPVVVLESAATLSVGVGFV